MHSIVESSEGPHEKLRERILAPLREILPDELIQEWCKATRCAPRCRRFGSVVILLGCILKHMGWISLRKLEDRMAGMSEDLTQMCRDGSVFCQARKRLAVRVFQLALRFLGQWACERRAELFHGLRVLIVDGTTSVLPNTDPLKRAFGVAQNQYGRSMLPLMRWVALVCQGSGVILDVAFGPYTVGEMRLFLLLVQRAPSGALIVGDTLFCSYTHMALLKQYGSHLLCPRHATRRDALRKKLGRYEELHVWKRPQPQHIRTPRHLLESLPEELEVRVIRCRLEKKGYRTQVLHLCTTLVDVKQYPATELLALYARRWNIELDLRHLKHTHGLDRLTAKDPGTVVREFYSGILAFNAIRALAVESGSPPRSLSHTRVCDAIVMMASQMAGAFVTRLPGLYHQLLLHIASCMLPAQERPPEPRVLVRDPRRSYMVIKVSRRTWKSTHAA